MQLQLGGRIKWTALKEEKIQICTEKQQLRNVWLEHVVPLVLWGYPTKGQSLWKWPQIKIRKLFVSLFWRYMTSYSQMDAVWEYVWLTHPLTGGGGVSVEELYWQILWNALPRSRCSSASNISIAKLLFRKSLLLSLDLRIASILIVICCIHDQYRKQLGHKKCPPYLTSE